ncbi:hypothetical protein [Endozoicomonas sp. 8E]|uniref:hypothetical protein n=1 Tax=Endozoicomonas sp. 8E TaxID=3035692 RepID=UPI0029394481|nr:hypothetical protein [Endozoicomonas sp. 8E]WOG30084.1 hypothetical protein P6910_10635 [Endozoicomonas sp. 8E]
MSVICRAKSLTGGFIIELEQNTDFSNQDFSIKPDWPALSGTRSDFAGSSLYPEPDLQSDHKRHRPDSYEVETPPVESTSWQWPYVTNLLVAYELILATKDKPLSYNPYSWVAAKAVIAVGWLLKSYWNRDSLLFNLIEQQEVSQNRPFAVTTVMPGSEHDQPQGQPPESSGQQATEVAAHPAGYLTHFLYPDSGDGNEDPQQDSHTLGLNCFVHPCNGVCRLRQSSGSIATGTDDTNTPAGRLVCNVVVFEKHGHLRQCGKVCKNERRLSCHKSKCHTGEKTCDVMVTGEDNQSQPCGTFCQNAGALSIHKARVHGNQRICKLTLLGKDGQLRPCEKVFKNNRSFATHKYKFHIGQRTCDFMVTGEDSQQRPCGVVCKNAQDLLTHKRSGHIGQTSCDVIVVSEDGQKRSCAFVGKNPQALWSHKSKIHSGQRICNVTLTGENGQQQSCGKVCRNAGALTDHKRTGHSGQQTCYFTVVGEDGQRWRCGKVCKNTKALSSHKRTHRKHKTVDMNQSIDMGSQKVK